MKKIGKIIKSKKFFLITTILIIIILISIVSIKAINTTISNNKIKQEEMSDFSFETKLFTLNDDYTYTFITLVTIQELDGIEQIKYTKEGSSEEMVLDCRGKTKVGIDFKALENKEYEFKIKPLGKSEKTEKLKVVRKSSGADTYRLVNGIYVNTPFLENFNSKYTRYLTLSNSVLKPAGWISGSEPMGWFDYKNRNWANVYVEAEGVEAYYVWIPRYVYKLDSNNERSDIKFVDVFNNYKNAQTGEQLNFAQLLEQGYKLPEAFDFGDESLDITSLSGYWISKYQLSELADYKLNFNMAASKTGITVNRFSNNVSSSSTKFTYAINGTIKNQTTSLNTYTFGNLTADEDYTVNVTALNSKGEIVGSMTKTITPAIVNPPNLEGFDPDTTFYVYYDEDGTEHNEIPISKDPPEDWYDYTYANWANIVVRNDGLESYYTWIPRYQYLLNSVSQMSNINFITGTGTETKTGYKIPEAFWWDKNDNGTQDEGEQLTGYWISKYQLAREEVDKKITAEIAPSSDCIHVKNITGTSVNTNLKYEYYLNGDLKHNGTSATENYTFTGLNLNTTYTVNIIARNKNTNAYVGAITKKVKTAVANPPDLQSFLSNSGLKQRTYYVIPNSAGTGVQQYIPITESAPSNWYDYSLSRWANIVVTDGTISGTTISNATSTSYFVWVPRYKYKILSSLNNWGLASISNARTDVEFITTDILPSNCGSGYTIPEAFWWDKNDNGIQNLGEQLSGYWISKYQLVDK